MKILLILLLSLILNLHSEEKITLSEKEHLKLIKFLKEKSKNHKYEFKGFKLKEENFKLFGPQTGAHSIKTNSEESKFFLKYSVKVGSESEEKILIFTVYPSTLEANKKLFTNRLVTQHLLFCKTKQKTESIIERKSEPDNRE